MSRAMRFFGRPRAPFWLFVLLGSIIRLLAVALQFGDHLNFADERMYLRLADVIRDGRWLGEGTMVAPGPVYFWGTLRALGFDLFGLRAAQALVGGLAVGVTFLIGRRLLGVVPALLAALVMTAYPYLLFMAGILYPQSVFHLALLMTIYAILRWMAGGRDLWIVGAGVALGLSALFVVPILSATPLFALWVVLARRDSLWRRARAVVLLGAVTLATILPATARNYVLEHRFVLISSMGGPAFYWANNDSYDPWWRDAERWLELYQRRQDREMARQGMTDKEMRELLTFRANRFWREQPVRAVKNYLIRLSFFFDVAPRSYTANAFTQNSRNDLIAIITSLPVLLLAPVGAWAVRRRWRLWLPLAAVPLFQAMTYAFFLVSVRYRIPFEPCFLLLAAAGFCGLILPETLKRREAEGLLPAGPEA